MSESLKQTTVKGIFWSFLEQFSKLGVTFVLGILMARILSPKEFGLIGMLSIFIAFSNSMIDSGFSNALIRKKSCNIIEYSTVFFFNIGVAILLYLLLFFSSPWIATFFKEPQLAILMKVLAIVLIFDSFSIIPRTDLIRNIDFKLQTKISLVANCLGGSIGIFMAYSGFGVWSLVGQQLVQRGLNALLLCWWCKWKPKLIFSLSAFKELFAFGSKLLVSGLINTAYRNVYLLVIGKYFSVTELGYYTRADQFKALPSQNLQSVIQRVTYPVLAGIQDDVDQLRSAYRKIIRCSMFISFVLMLGMAAASESLIVVLIGEKWLPAVPYLQLLCMVGMLYPLHALNLNMLKVLGRSDLFLKLEIIKDILAVPTIIVGILWGIKMMIIALFITSVIAFFLNSYWSGKMIGYSSLQQLKDILPSFILALGVAVSVYILGDGLSFVGWGKLLSQVGFGLFLTFLFSELLRFSDYLYLKQIVLSGIRVKAKKWYRE